MFQDHAGLPEPLRDHIDEHLADLEAEVQAEIEWLSPQIAECTGESAATVTEILRVRDRVLAKAASAEGEQP